MLLRRSITVKIGGLRKRVILEIWEKARLGNPGKLRARLASGYNQGRVAGGVLQPPRCVEPRQHRASLPFARCCRGTSPTERQDCMSNRQRLKAIAAELRKLEKANANEMFSKAPNLFIEALDLGTFGDPRHLPLRNLLGRLRRQELPGWRINAWMAICDHFLAAYTSVQNQISANQACPIIADLIEADARRRDVKPRRPAASLTTEDKTLLEALADEYPMAVTQSDLQTSTRIPRQKISQRLKWLEARPRRYVERPQGTKRKGHAITVTGLSAIGRPVEGPH
jgi:hypothetical protein